MPAEILGGPVYAFQVPLTYTIQDNAGLTATGQIDMYFYEPDYEQC